MLFLDVFNWERRSAGNGPSCASNSLVYLSQLFFSFCRFFPSSTMTESRKKEDDFHQPLSSPNLKLFRQLKHLKQKLNSISSRKLLIKFYCVSSLKISLIIQSLCCTSICVKREKKFLANKNSLSSRKGFAMGEARKSFSFNSRVVICSETRGTSGIFFQGNAIT